MGAQVDVEALANRALLDMVDPRTAVVVAVVVRAAVPVRSRFDGRHELQVLVRIPVACRRDINTAAMAVRVERRVPVVPPAQVILAMESPAPPERQGYREPATSRRLSGAPEHERPSGCRSRTLDRQRELNTI